MNKKILLTATVAIAAVAYAAQASDQGYYVSGMLGASLMPDQSFYSATGATSKNSFDAGYAYGGAVGYDSGQGWRVELDTLHQQSAIDRINGVLASGHLQSTSLMLNGTYDLAQFETFTPYVGAGLGFQIIGADIGGYSNGGDVWQPAYQVEAGVRHDIGHNLSLFAEYRYSQAESTRLSNGVDYGNEHFTDHALLTGITYHLGEGF